MSIDSTRKQTKGWEINSSGKMVNITAGGGDGVVIDEGVPVTESAFVKTEPPPLPGMPRHARGPEPKVPAPPAAEPPADRVRRSTLDLFNDEMAVMEKPIEGDVEYVDEAPPPSRWRNVGIFVGIVAVMGVGGGLVLAKKKHERMAAFAQAAAPAPAPSPAAAPAVLAATTPPAAAAAPAPAAAAEDDSAADDAPAQPPATHAAWDKVKAKSGSKHAHSSAKSSHHRSSKRTVSAKRSSSRHH